MADFHIEETADHEFTIEPLTKRAQEVSMIPAGQRAVQKTRSEAADYVKAHEGMGFTFSGKAVLTR